VKCVGHMEGMGVGLRQSDLDCTDPGDVGS